MASRCSVVTNLPPLPAGTSKVDIVLPGLTTLRDMAVTAPRMRHSVPQDLPYGSRNSGPIGPTRHILAGSRGIGLRLCRGQYQLHDYRATVDTIVR